MSVDNSYDLVSLWTDDGSLHSPPPSWLLDGINVLADQPGGPMTCLADVHSPAQGPLNCSTAPGPLCGFERGVALKLRCP
jgi:hypothetical protein